MEKNLRHGFALGAFTIEPLTGGVFSETGEAAPVHLLPKAMDVLLCLAEHQGEVVEREALMSRVWGRKSSSEEVLTKCVSELRRAFGDDPQKPRYIKTAPSRGYMLLQTPVPLAPPAGQVATTKPARSGAETLRALRFLLIDDHEMVRETIALAVEQMAQNLGRRIECLEAASCEEATAFAGADIDMILLDLGLPGLHGLEAIAKIRETFETAPITIVSGVNDPRTMDAARQAGAIGYVPKTMSTANLCVALGAALKQCALLDADAITGRSRT